MSEQQHGQRFGMTQEEKAKLLASLRGGAKQDLKTRSLARSVPSEYTRFDTLPSYTQVQIEKAVARKLGVPEPYYVCHDGLSQETATLAGKTLLNFSCYDYLGLNGDPRILEAVCEAGKTYGISASASRLTAGERPPHRMLEQKLAALHETEDCLVFVSGHATNLSAISSLFGAQDVIFYDEACHNSIVLGAALSNAARFSFPTNDIAALRVLLETRRYNFHRALLVTEGLFGMDGVLCRLPDLLDLKKEFSCFLMVDEAHSMGTVGRTGRGVGEHFGVRSTDVDIWMGTLSKTFCGCGGYIAGSSALVDILRYQAPGFVYSVGMPPLLAAGSAKAIDCMLEEPWRVESVQEKSAYMLRLAQEAGLTTGSADGFAVIPIMIGNSLTAVVLSHLLKEHGVLALPIIFPGVQEGRARLRFFVSHRHKKSQIEQAISLTSEFLPHAQAKAESFAG